MHENSESLAVRLAISFQLISKCEWGWKPRQSKEKERHLEEVQTWKLCPDKSRKLEVREKTRSDQVPQHLKGSVDVYLILGLLKWIAFSVPLPLVQWGQQVLERTEQHVRLIQQTLCQQCSTSHWKTLKYSVFWNAPGLNLWKQIKKHNISSAPLTFFLHCIC